MQFASFAAAFFTNPQYIMRLEAEADSDDDDDDDDDEDVDDKCTLVVSLTQKYARAKKTRRKVDTDPSVAIGFSVFKVW